MVSKIFFIKEFFIKLADSPHQRCASSYEFSSRRTRLVNNTIAWATSRTFNSLNRVSAITSGQRWLFLESNLRSKEMMRSFFRWFLLVPLISLVVACADSVSQRMPAIKQDLAQFQTSLFVPVRPATSELAKDSAVSLAIDFEGIDAGKIAGQAEEALRKLRYVRKENRLDGIQETILYCHEEEAGRSATIVNSGPQLRIAFRVSGWSEDKQKCPGKNVSK